MFLKFNVLARHVVVLLAVRCYGDKVYLGIISLDYQEPSL